MKDNIIITCFPFKVKDGYNYRVYFTDVVKDYIHNPIVIEKDRTFYPGVFTAYTEAINWINKEIENYIK